VVEGRRYFRCSICALRFLAADQLPAPVEEKEHYDTHENDIKDPRYREFLGRLARPLIEKLAPGASGLDFGCGPGPALAAMFEESGFRMTIYDPFYAPDQNALAQNYDFITLTEVAEHLHHPGKVFHQLDQMLNPGGWLAVMTQLGEDDAHFASWYYRRDPTHVAFYRRATFAHLCQIYGYGLGWPHASVALMQKPLSNRRNATGCHD